MRNDLKEKKPILVTGSISFFSNVGLESQIGKEVNDY